MRSTSPCSRAISVVLFASSAAGRRVRGVLDELDREHRPQPAHLADLAHARRRSPRAARGSGRRELPPSPGSRRSRPRRGRPRQPRRRRGCRRTCRRARRAGRRRRPRPAGDAGERKSAAQRLARDDEIGLDLEVLDRPDRAGTTDSRLHLVGDVDDAVLPAERAQPLEELAGHRDEPTLALHRLEHDAGDRGRVDVRLEQVLERSDRGVRVDAAVRVRRRRRGRPRARTGRTPACTGRPCSSSSSRAASGRGRRSRRRRRPGGRWRRARS